MVVNDELMTWNEAVDTNFKVLFQHFLHIPPPQKKTIKSSKQPIDSLTEFIRILTVRD